MSLIPINIKVTEDTDYYITAEMDAQIYSRIIPDGIVKGVGNECDMSVQSESISIKSGLICIQGYLAVIKDTLVLPYLPSEGTLYIKAKISLGTSDDVWSIKVYNTNQEVKKDLFKGGREREVLLATVQGTQVTMHNKIDSLEEALDKTKTELPKLDIAIQEELNRVAAETTRISEENVRKQNETIRIQSESNRVSAERVRSDAENTRVQSENVRKNEENVRNLNEKIRTQSESNRVSAEINRVQAESNRVEAENTRQQWFNAAKSTFDNSELGQLTNRIDEVNRTAQTLTEKTEEIASKMTQNKESVDREINLLKNEEQITSITVQDNELRITRKKGGVFAVPLPKNDSVIAYQLANQIVAKVNDESVALALRTQKALGKTLIILKGDNPDNPTSANRPLLNVENLSDLNNLNGDMLSFLAPLPNYSNWKTLLTNNLYILDLYLTHVTIVPEGVKTYLLSLMETNTEVSTFIIGHPHAVKVTGTEFVDKNLATKINELIVIAKDESLVQRSAYHPIYRNLFRTEEMLSAIESLPFLSAFVLDWELFLIKLMSSDSLKHWAYSNNKIFQLKAKEMYQIVSTSGKWIKNGGLTKQDSFSHYWYESQPNIIVFANVGAYSKNGTTKILHPNGTEAGRGSIQNMPSKSALDLDNLIVTFDNFSGSSVSGDDYYIYEKWQLKN